MQRNGTWEHFEHEADIGIRGCGDSVETAFTLAASAMVAVISDPAGIKPDQAVRLHCQAPDLELLLVDWLNALIYEMATRKMLFSRFETVIDNLSLEGRAWGEPVDVARHQPAVEIKGATFTALRVWQPDSSRWCAQCVVDV